MKKLKGAQSLFCTLLVATLCACNNTKASDSGRHNIMIETLSDEDQWLKVSQNDLKSDLTRKLADAYNAAVVKNSIFTDFDMQMHFGRGEDMVHQPVTDSCMNGTTP